MMSSIKAGKSIHENKKAQNQLQFFWRSVPKLRRSSRMKRVLNHLLVKFSCSACFRMRSKLYLLRLKGVFALSNIHPRSHLMIRISRVWLFSKHLLLVAREAKKSPQLTKKSYLNMWNQSMMYSVFYLILLLVWSASRYMGICFHKEFIMGSRWPITKITSPLLFNSLILFGRRIW